MRIITQHCTYVYKSKSSAMRAARKAVGHQYLVEAPELGSRFDGVIPVTEEMISVGSWGDGWRWPYTFDLADVLVCVRHADGDVADVRYREVAHWENATTPCFVAACYSNGQIEISTTLNVDARPMFCGDEAPLQDFIAATARLAYDGNTFLVPGLPESPNYAEKLEALGDWLFWACDRASSGVKRYQAA